MKSFILITVVIFALIIPVSAQYYDIDLSDALQDELFALCDEYEVDEKLILAVISVESSYRADVISHTNDYGLMQINKINHGWLGELLDIDDFLDPVQNMRAGIYLYSQYMDLTDGDIHKSAMMYKYGEYGAERLFSQGVYESVYSRKIIRIMDELELR